MNPQETAALQRLIDIAQGDTGQGRRVADFLLAWWNSASCGGFDLTILWGVDSSIAQDIVSVFSCLARVHHNSDTLGYGESFQLIERHWRSPATTQPFESADTDFTRYPEA